jgi:Flp pilus assembly pilin Flp
MHSIMRLLRDENAGIEMEYGLFAALFAVGAVAVLQQVEVLEGLMPHRAAITHRRRVA